MNLLKQWPDAGEGRGFEDQRKRKARPRSNFFNSWWSKKFLLLDVEARIFQGCDTVHNNNNNNNKSNNNNKLIFQPKSLNFYIFIPAKKSQLRELFEAALKDFYLWTFLFAWRIRMKETTMTSATATTTSTAAATTTTTTKLLEHFGVGASTDALLQVRVFLYHCTEGFFKFAQGSISWVKSYEEFHQEEF